MNLVRKQIDPRIRKVAQLVEQKVYRIFTSQTREQMLRAVLGTQCAPPVVELMGLVQARVVDDLPKQVTYAKSRPFKDQSEEASQKQIKTRRPALSLSEFKALAKSSEQRLIRFSKIEQLKDFEADLKSIEMRIQKVRGQSKEAADRMKEQRKQKQQQQQALKLERAVKNKVQKQKIYPPKVEMAEDIKTGKTRLKQLLPDLKRFESEYCTQRSKQFALLKQKYSRKQEPQIQFPKGRFYDLVERLEEEQQQLAAKQQRQKSERAAKAKAFSNQILQKYESARKLIAAQNQKEYSAKKPMPQQSSFAAERKSLGDVYLRESKLRARSKPAASNSEANRPQRRRAIREWSVSSHWKRFDVEGRLKKMRPRVWDRAGLERYLSYSAYLDEEVSGRSQSARAVFGRDSDEGRAAADQLWRAARAKVELLEQLAS